MSEPIWVPMESVHIFHDLQIARHGGASGLRDEVVLQNAMQRSVNKWQYEGADTFECVAAYAHGIAKAHAFVDRNKRTAFVTEPAEGVAFMAGLASDEVSEDKFKKWLESGSKEIQ